MRYEELSTAGQRLRWLRVASDLTQTSLGARSSVGQRMLSYFERDVYVPRKSQRKAIAEALGVHPDFIWHDADLANRKRVAA